jgi:hypothetical protein
VLIAIAAPWLLMFALLGQMHERYLVWGAVVSAVALGVNIRLSIIHFIISAASTAMIVHVMLIDKKLDATLRAIDVLEGIRPYASGLVLACIAVYFWHAIGVSIAALQRGVPKLLRGLPCRSNQSRRKPEIWAGSFGFGQRRNTTPAQKPPGKRAT